MYVFGILGIALVVVFGGELIRNFDKLKGSAGLTVEVISGDAQVTVDGKPAGATPLSSNEIKPGKNTVTIKNDTRQYQTTIDFLPATKDTLHVVGIIRDLGTSDTFSSGQEFWFEKDTTGNVLKIISEPSGATVYLDNTEIGTTPFTSNIISPGGYDIRISYSGYESQDTRVNVQEGYTVNGNVKLFPIPIKTPITTFEGSPNLYDLTNDNPALTTDTAAWTKAVIYWNETRGINIKDVGTNKEKVFDYFIDYLGNIFDSEGTLVNTGEALNNLQDIEKGAYLGKAALEEGLTAEAREALNSLVNAGLAVKQATILSTPTGWLRVRNAPGLNGAEVTKVDVGDTFPVLDESNGWTKIKVNDSTQGWVSDTYITTSSE